MELQFKKKSCDYVKNLVSRCKEQELTDEIRVPDSLGDVGRILGAWGQVIIRGKEWRPERVGVTGGVMAWVLYEPEGETTPQMLETWLPFNEQCSIPETQHDGVIMTQGNLTFCDARSVSPRKLILRVGFCLDVQVYAVAKQDLYTPEDVPENIYVRTIQQPIMLPAEAGEKSFSVEEQLPQPDEITGIDKILRYNVTPRLLESKVSGSRIIFRGVADVHVMVLNRNGRVCSFDLEAPFSQYTQLEKDYEDDAEGTVRFAVTNLELETAEQHTLRLKAGLTGQYLIKEPVILEVADDAYCPAAQLQLQHQQVELPVLMQHHCNNVRVQRPCKTDGGEIIDAEFLTGLPELHCKDDKLNLLLSGRFYVLFYDTSSQLQSMTLKWEQEEQTDVVPDVQVQVSVMSLGKVGADPGGIYSDINTEYICSSPKGIEMISGLTVSESFERTDRPAMGIRRAGKDRLWDIAKESGSTVEAIRTMTGLADEPGPEQMLLIPIP